MARFDLAEWRTQFPELAGKSDDAVTRASRFALELSSNTQQQLYLCTAHVVVLDAERQDTPDGGSGVVVSEGEGGARVAYLTQAQTGNEDAAKRAFYASTFYGRMLLALEDRSPLGGVPMVVE